PSARWQAGFVRDGASWRSFDETTTGNAQVREQYLARRHEAPQSFPGQLELANWCRKQGLAEQERAHLTGALALSTDRDNSDLLRRLGYREIGGFWLSREDLREWRSLNQQTEASLKRWQSRLNGIASGLAGSARQREGALAKLREITDASAIPAI